MKTGLVLEGGAMRGMFTAGVLDILMEKGISFDGAVGVSAGAAFGCNIKSHQIGRVIRYVKKYCRNKEFVSIRSWIRTGDLYGADFGYRQIPQVLDPFDVKTFAKSPMDFYVVATDMDTGKAVYHQLYTGDMRDVTWMRASASMPVASRPVIIDGKKLSDGGTSDSIPLKFMEEKGFQKNLVVLTQPAGYRKEQMKHFGLVKFLLRKYPQMIRALSIRPEMYNSEVEYVHQRARDGAAFILQPPEALGIGSVCHDPEELERVYQIGRRTAEGQLPEIGKFLSWAKDME